MTCLYYFSFCFFLICCQLSLLNSSLASKYLKFSYQNEPPIDEATNHAILNSEPLMELPSARFTICSSIFVAFFRGYQSFYTVWKSDQETLWFSLFFENQDTTQEIYKSIITYDGGSVYSKKGAEVTLKPHAWSHAFTTVDIQSGNIIVVINGILTHNTTINSRHYTDHVPTLFKNNLVLGVCQYKYPASEN